MPLWATLTPRCARTPTGAVTRLSLLGLAWTSDKSDRTSFPRNSPWVTDICCNVTKVRHLLLRHLEIMAIQSRKDSHGLSLHDLLRTRDKNSFSTRWKQKQIRTIQKQNSWVQKVIWVRQVRWTPYEDWSVMPSECTCFDHSCLTSIRLVRCFCSKALEHDSNFVSPSLLLSV